MKMYVTMVKMRKEKLTRKRESAHRRGFRCCTCGSKHLKERRVLEGCVYDHFVQCKDCGCLLYKETRQLTSLQCVRKGINYCG